MLLNIGVRLIWQLSLTPAAYRGYLSSNGLDVSSPFLSKKFLTILQLLSALISGVGMALNWTTLGYYVNMCGDESNRGRFHGLAYQYFTMGYLCALFFGGLIADHFGILTLYCVIPVVTLFAGVVALGLPTPEPIENEIVEQEMGQIPTDSIESIDTLEEPQNQE